MKKQQQTWRLLTEIKVTPLKTKVYFVCFVQSSFLMLPTASE